MHIPLIYSHVFFSSCYAGTQTPCWLIYPILSILSHPKVTVKRKMQRKWSGLLPPLVSKIFLERFRSFDSLHSLAARGRNQIKSCRQHVRLGVIQRLMVVLSEVIDGYYSSYPSLFSCRTNRKKLLRGVLAALSRIVCFNIMNRVK